MAQDTIDLQCPACKTMLELDIGFAGGVCRCFKCATLMTVPADPQRGSAETLRRPDSPGGRPDAPPGARPAAPGAAADDDEVQAAFDDEEHGTQTFVTSTGRVVTLDAGEAIPTAVRKRKGVRALTIGAFVGVIALVVAATVVAIITVATQPPPATGVDLDDPTVQATLIFAHDPSVNPMTLEQPNVMGLPLSMKTSVLIDTAGMDEATRGQVAALVASGLAHPVPKVRVLVAGTGDETPRTFDGGATALAGLDAGKLKAFITSPVAGKAKLDDAMRAALKLEPTSMVIITGRRIPEEQVKSAAELARAQASLIVDVVMIGSPTITLEDIARATGGRSVILSRTRLTDWVDGR